ncbi:GNAT family N-acetyltransferase [Streptomyces sp. NPDC046887]|uniref:GNAT family N-acetyltransferase n=1 Tax=Streptomyces sp. NPDC046887 TaxID=3155472 RepID=UPI00340F4055
MDQDAVRALYDEQMRRGARPDGPGVTVERVGDVVRQTGPAHAWNGVLWSRLEAHTADRAIREQLEHYTALGLGFEWKHYDHDGPADLAVRLLAAGLTAEEPESLLVAETGGADTAARPPEGVELHPVTDPAGVELVARVHAEAFGTDASDLRRRLLDRLAAHPGTVAAVVALADGRPVSSARLELTPGTAFAGLWGGGTVPGWRGRGIYRTLVAHRARIAAEHGYRYLQVDATEMSRPILERLGFVRLATTTPYVHTPGR